MILTDAKNVFLPYALQIQNESTKNKNAVYTVVNREYQQLGKPSHNIPAIKITDKIINQICVNPKEALEVYNYTTIYFYDDATNPLTNEGNMQAYLKRLSIFAKLKLEM